MVRRTVPLRPNGSHHYARVVSAADKLRHDGSVSGMKLVRLQYKDAAGFVRIVNSKTPAVLHDIRVGDPVLFKRYSDLDKATPSWWSTARRRRQSSVPIMGPSSLKFHRSVYRPATTAEREENTKRK